MRRRTRRHGGPALHLKLLALAGLCVVALWGAFILLWRMGPSADDRNDIERSVQHYVGYLTQDLGPNPGEVRAKQLAQNSGWQFRWQGSDGTTWVTDSSLLPMADLKIFQKPGRNWGWHHGLFFSLKENSTGSLVLAFRPWKPRRLAGIRLIVFLCAALWILAFSAFVARRMLRPLRDLDLALAMLAEGDLSARLPETQRNDELGRLTRRFNQTAAELGRMLESRRQLLLDVSHELRTPLTRLNLGLELMKDDAARGPMKEDVAEMEAMLVELLESARIEVAARWQPQAVDLVALCNDVADDLKSRKPGLKFDLPTQPLTVMGDERGLQILVRNLCDNAIKYSAKQPLKVEAKLWQEDSKIHLEVRDHGPGIAEEALPHLFEPFYRADASRNRATGGFGLGLHLVLKAVLAHGGNVSVRNADGGGALFSVSLPYPKSGDTAQ